MTATLAQRRANDRVEWQSLVAVILVTVLAVGAGLIVLNRTADQSRRVDRSGINVDVPAAWIVTEPAGDVILSAYDPHDHDLRYTVAGVTAAGRTPQDVAQARIASRRALIPGLAVVEDGAGAIGDVVTHRLRYTFAPPSGGAATLIEAREDYVADANRVLIVGLEAPRGAFSAAQSAFESFARQVVAGRRPATGNIGRPLLTVATRPAGAVAAPAARLASAFGGPGPTLAAPATAADLVSATVQIFDLSDATDPLSATGWGSGTIISADGLVLTNAHVAKPTAGGLAVRELDPTQATDPAALVIAIVEDEAKPAVPRYRATVIAADGYLDAALLRIDKLADGSALPANLKLPFLPVGDSDALHVGDKLTVVGFPGIGGDTISLSSGQVSGFIGDSRLGARAWMKTDAVVSQGNSGGLAANAAGELVGLPTRANPNDTGGYSYIRPVAFLKPMVAAALAGHPSLESTYVVAATGNEQMTFDTWSHATESCEGATRLTTYPKGTREIVALFRQTGMAAGEDIVSQWSQNGEVVFRSLMQVGSGSAGGCVQMGISLDRGLDDGTYRVEVFAGPHLRPMSSAVTTIGAAAAGSASASVSGRVVDVDSGKPLPNAAIYFLTPGTDPATWLSAPTNAT
ncbi:MAG TPA: serine protease, partial [Candidatus Limnocylindrales bacterium]